MLVKHSLDYTRYILYLPQNFYNKIKYQEEAVRIELDYCT